MAKKMTDQELKEMAQRVLAKLTPIEQQILEMRFGIKPVDIKEVEQRFEATRKRVREIEAKALKALRRPRRHKFLE